ncbi:uncharacterized protein LOC124689559 [Lolium rigidum]|uniref:uncharacterized protein LOC124689559 n=1 Tax=Lolium rigidum TaxID=89674 RepID=UPI001F5D4D04|nr:uncharacterized protein LOC124689559 [Lolium rigidum]
MAPPPPPPLVDDVTAEILLRLPPDEPEHLIRAALVCKPWLRVICDPGFRRSYRDFHGAPPLLGFLHRLMPKEIDWLIYSAAVLCAADGCDHLDCHGGPFRVVFAATHDHKDIIVASVYSSETGEWSSPVCLDNTCEIYARHIREARAQGLLGRFYTPYLQPRRGALVGDAVYFTVRWGNAIVKYDLGKDRLSMIDPPQPYVYGIAVTAMENYTSLGFTCIQGSTLHTWSKKMDTEETAEWVQYRVIELEKAIPVTNPEDELSVVGFAEGVGVIFVCSGAGLFMIKLNSGQVKKVDEPGEYFSVLPYMSFYLPSNGGGHDATDLPHNT